MPQDAMAELKKKIDAFQTTMKDQEKALKDMLKLAKKQQEVEQTMKAMSSMLRKLNETTRTVIQNLR